MVLEGVAFSRSSLFLGASLRDATPMNLTRTNDAHFHLPLPRSFFCLARRFFVLVSTAFSREHDLCPSSGDPKERPSTFIQLPIRVKLALYEEI